MAKAAKKSTAQAVVKKCNCISLCNKALEKDGIELDSHFSFTFGVGKASATSELRLPVRKIDPKSRGKLPTLVCTFCPICGVRLQRP